MTTKRTDEKTSIQAFVDVGMDECGEKRGEAHLREEKNAQLLANPLDGAFSASSSRVATGSQFAYMSNSLTSHAWPLRAAAYDVYSYIGSPGSKRSRSNRSLDAFSCALAGFLARVSRLSKSIPT